MKDRTAQPRVSFGFAMGFALVSFLTPAISFAGDINVSAGVRADYISEADVWARPAWVDENFQFSNSLNILSGPAVNAPWNILNDAPVTCQTSQADLEDSVSGRTPKFKCALLQRSADGLLSIPVLKANGEPLRIKVKYGADNKEIQAEIAGTRLLTALGFGADQMFYSEHTFCFGCSADPFRDRQLDTTTLSTPRDFYVTAIEKKHDGDEIISTPTRPMRSQPDGVRQGWNWGELMAKVSNDPDRRREQLIQRDALRLLAVFLMHTDNKDANQRIVCLNGANGDRCDGRKLLMIHDIGLSFGGGWRWIPPGVSRVHVRRWRNRSMWRNAQTCDSNTGLTMDGQLINPRITEEGRQFLVKLLDGFTAGEAGRARVRDLFRAGHFELSGSSVDEWTEAFMHRVEQIKYPAGRTNPGFRCPRGWQDL